MQSLKPALQHSEGRFSRWGGAQLVNCFAELSDGDKREPFAIMAIPGLVEWADVGAGPVRGAHVLGGYLYVVSGAFLYQVTSSGVATLIGGVGGTTSKVRMATNYTELALVSDGIGYVYNGTSLTRPLGYNVSDVTYVDGYILWTVYEAEQFFISGLDAATTYDAADISSAEGMPDDIVGVLNDHRDIHFFGQRTTEIYYNSGDADFPFERQGNAFIERGCFDRDSLVKIDNTVTFVGDDRVVYNLTGYQPKRISTHAIEYELRNATYARAFTYTQEGHCFYVLDTDNGTFAFDHTIGAWHKRQSNGLTGWRVGGAVQAFNEILLLSNQDGKIYTPDFDTHTEDGVLIPFDIYLPTIEAGRERQTMYAFEVVCETGVGNSSASDPQIMLTYSDDGGHSWSNEMWRSMGTVGNYQTRALWRKLGQFRERRMRLRITDSARRLIIDYRADIA